MAVKVGEAVVGDEDLDGVSVGIKVVGIDDVGDVEGVIVGSFVGELVGLIVGNFEGELLSIGCAVGAL